MKMNIQSRLLQALAALLLAPAFLLPLWSIRMVAPQYSDGLGMFIGLRDIWGHRPHDIQNINILNHYIGMMPIEPDRVEVLRIMPWAVLFLIGSGLVVALVGRRRLVYGWLAAFAALGSAGLYEFYRWQHMYGHNLDPMAPIKVPGMTYQPPFIGSKTLLNITASSYPSWGTLFIALSFALGVTALFWGRWRTFGRAVVTTRPALRLRHALSPALVLLALAVAGCARADARPDALRDDRPRFGAAGQTDAFCDGQIPPTRFGGEVVTRGGETHAFMSVECMAGFVASGRVSAGEIERISVVDYNSVDRLIDARAAHYVRMQFQRSPSGLDLAATETEKVAANLHYFMGGQRMSWDEVLAFVAAEWEL
jgi:copper chaperone NosL